jgi:hypothetical protein
MITIVHFHKRSITVACLGGRSQTSVVIPASGPDSQEAECAFRHRVQTQRRMGVCDGGGRDNLCGHRLSDLDTSARASLLAEPKADSAAYFVSLDLRLKWGNCLTGQGSGRARASEHIVPAAL